MFTFEKPISILLVSIFCKAFTLCWDNRCFFIIYWNSEIIWVM